MADKVIKTSKSAVAKKAVKATEVKTIEQLRTDLLSKITDQLEAKRGLKQGELANPHILTVIRKEIARLHTAIRAVEIAALKGDK
jgi:ribosomal protein L29